MKIKSSSMAIILSMAFTSLAIAHPGYTGYSGAPGSDGSCASSCHGSSGGSIEISGFPTEYNPGENYTIVISHNGGNSIKNFNGSCRIGTGSDNAGTISSGTMTSTYNVSNETNGIHLSSTNQNTASFHWTAPPSGTGEVRLYIAGHQGSYSGQNTSLTLSAMEVATGIDDQYSGMPDNFALFDNYPNPFNASTVISYNLPRTSDVSIAIYDLLGREVETIVEGSKSAGYHQITWSADEYPSGVYFYKIKAGEFAQTRRMTLLK